MRLLLYLSLCFASGALCNIAAYGARHNFAWFVCTAASILCYYCFFSRVIHYLDEGE